MLSVGTLIWVSIRPLLRLLICTGAGFTLAKKDILSPLGARGAAEVVLRIALPCLVFSKIVPAFNHSNISALGPLILVAVLYELLGVAIAWTIKQFFWVPHRFRYGILVAGGWSNWGDIPTSVVLSITASVPFNGIEDQNLAVAYVGAFMLVYMVTLFPMGIHRLIALDYEGPEVEGDEVRETLRLKKSAVLRFGWIRRLSTKTLPQADDEKCEYTEKGSESPTPALDYSAARKHVSYDSEKSHTVSSEFHPTDTILPEPQSSPPPTRTRKSIFLAQIRTFFYSIASSPPCIGVLVAFPLALVPQLKALFTPVPGTYMPNAPDGQPPLAFILDATNFIGGASVPLSLVCLGSALARLKVPKNQWGTLPLGAITSLAIGKTLVMPVLGVLICQGLVNIGFINGEDKVLQFVCIFFSCLPTATTQVYLTQIYSGTGNGELMSAFLIPQYFLMIFGMTGLTAYALHMLF